MQTILTVPDQLLRKVSKPIKSIDKKLAEFLKDLGVTLLKKDDPPGVGISAIQVGKAASLFYTYMDPDPKVPAAKWNPKQMELTLFVNPKIVNQSKELTLGGTPKRPQMEGCLSIPRLYGPVWRHSWVEVEYQTIAYERINERTTLDDFETISARYEAFPARVIQHEFDHLKGVLFTDYLETSNLPLFLEEDDELVEIQDPSILLKW